ncbi:MAG: ribose-phosphate diphosphokinase [Methanoregula sp.]|nr:MAG: ribose-phosphate diphosphokinase [Methanoregula sp.]
MKIISTEPSQVLAGRIADAAKTSIIDVKFSRFPDGELYLCANGLEEDMVIVGSVVDSDSLVQLVLLIDACEGLNNQLVIPYMGYARQDKRFKAGEPISARAISRVLSHGVNRCITVNIHDKRVLSYFDIPASDISLANDIGSYINSMGFDDPLILAPDDGAAAFAKAVAAYGSWDQDHLNKTRISGDEVRIAPRTLSAADRSVIIVDDIISTGGTIATAAAMLREQGACDVFAACVHGVLTGGAFARLKASGIQEVVCSDTIERGCSRFSAADRIVEALAQ